MRRRLTWFLVPMSLFAGCADDTSLPPDVTDATDTLAEDASDLREAEDEAAEEVADDASDDADTFACPDITPEDETLTSESVANILVTALPGSTTFVSVAICRYDSPFAWATRLATSGPCRVLDWLPVTGALTGADLDTGDITVEIGGVAVPITDASATVPCGRRAEGTVPTPEPGDAIRAFSTGGTDVPAFDISLVVPEPPEVTEPAAETTFTACLPWRVAWTPADATDVSLLVRANDPVDEMDFGIHCRGLTASPLELPAELTTLWPAALTTGHVELSVVPSATSTTTPAVTLELDLRQAERRVVIARP